MKVREDTHGEKTVTVYENEESTAVPPRSAQKELQEHRKKWLHPKYEYAVYPTMVKHRLRNGRDWQGVISADNAGTGVGKSTLAVMQALAWDQNGWDMDKFFMSIDEYLYYYNNKAEPGDVLILDEATEYLMSRRAMSNDNVEFIRALARNRSLQVITLVVLPHVGLIDKLVKVFADGWQHITRTGKAVNHFWYYSTYTQEARDYVMKGPLSGGKEATYWKWNEDIQPYLDAIEAKKDEVRDNKHNTDNLYDEEEVAKKTVREIRSYRDTVAQNVAQMRDDLGLRQKDVAKMFLNPERDGTNVVYSDTMSQRWASDIEADL